MAKFIVDSGATSAKWCLISNDETTFYDTEGLNPYHRSKKSICKVIRNELMPNLNSPSIKEFYFYGAGCDNSSSRKVIYQSLSSIFPDAAITIKLDLLGSARACLSNNPGIVCILGTGSNSCLYDGHNIVEHIPSLSYVLGDEGSAAYFGKKIIKHYYRFKLPEGLKNKLEENYDMDLSYIQQHLYKGQQPSQFVASYGKFLGDHSEHPFIKKMLKRGFRVFVKDVVKQYTHAQRHDISFVGSVAFAHHHLLKELLKEEGLTAGIFLQNPLKKLVEFHNRYDKNKIIR